MFVGASGPAIDEVDLAGVDLAADVVFGPAAVVEGRVDEFDSCAGFAVGWDHPFSAWLHCNKETAALRCQGGGDGQYGDVMGADAARLTALAQVRAARGVLVCGRRGDYSMVGAGRQVGEEALSPPLKGIFVPTPLSQSREGGVLENVMWVFRVPESRHASVRRGGGWGAVCDAGDNDAGDGVADPGGAGPAGQALREGEDVDTVGEGEGPWSSPRTGDTDEGGDVAEDGARGAEACGRIGCRRSPRIRVQASEPMQKVIQHLMDFLTNHLSSEDKACLW